MTRARFELIPAIDLLGGECVRLAQGDYAAATVYEADPAAAARRFASHAVPRLHVVDLDGARAGRPVNIEAIRAITSAVGALPVQLGGGLRDLAAVEAAFEMGVSRVVLGTAALRDPALVRDAARKFPGRIAVGLDAKNGRVSVEGWLDTGEATVIEVARRFEDAGVAALVHTDIARDGMLTGPNLAASAELADAVGIPVIVSGGVANEDDVVAAARLAPRGIAGAIAGRALYTGALDLDSALRRLASL